MKLRFLLDTNICIYIAKQKPISVLDKFTKLSIGEVGMSAITYGELLYGAEKSMQPQKTLRLLEVLADQITPIPLSTDVANYYGDIRSKLERLGQTIGNNDLWIAAHTLSLQLILVTNNTREFSKVPHLKIENWID